MWQERPELVRLPEGGAIPERLGTPWWCGSWIRSGAAGTTVHDLTHRDFGLKVLTGQGATIGTTTPTGQLMFGIFAALSE